MNGRSNIVLIGAVVVVFVTTIGAVVALAVLSAEPDGTIGVLMAALAPTIASLITLSQVNRTSGQVEQLTNGLMDSKIRTGVADVIKPNLIDPNVHAQLTEDRATVAAGDGQGGGRARAAPEPRGDPAPF